MRRCVNICEMILIVRCLAEELNFIVYE